MSEVILALDFPAQREALTLVDQLGDAAGFYKVGLELYTREGPGIVRALKGRGKQVFLDLKLFDIPNTVERAVASVAALGADMVTVHATGGSAMMSAAAQGAAGEMDVVAVTLLTSLGADDVAAVWNRPVDELLEEVLRLGEMSRDSGVQGVVASALEARALRDLLGPAALVVTPGIRLPGGDRHDQTRVATPGDAAAAGASHLVVGRAVTGADDPVAALQAVLEHLAAGT